MLICSLRFTAHLAAFLDSSMVPPSLGLLPEDSLVPGSESSVNAKFVSILKTKSLNRWVVTSESHHNQGSHLLNPCFFFPLPCQLTLNKESKGTEVELIFFIPTTTWSTKCLSETIFLKSVTMNLHGSSGAIAGQGHLIQDCRRL